MSTAVVTLNLPDHQYEVRIQPGALTLLGDWLVELNLHQHHGCALLVDPQLPEQYITQAKASITAAGMDIAFGQVGVGEKEKSLDTVRRLYDVMLDARLERKSPAIALGGGITGDTVGFVAASYLRGVPFVQCPTTLLAMVDASVGGKTGVNVPQGKNLIGAFHQPHLVVIDTDTLKTLPQRELKCGLAECVKHGVIRDASLFEWIETHLDAILALDTDTLVELVRWNVAIKARVVEADEKEAGVRAHLNLGHTFAHAIEATAGYGAQGESYHHGEAVSLGTIAATQLASRAGRCGPDLLDRLTKLLDRIGLPTRSDHLAPDDALLASMRHDKKVDAGRIRLVLPDRLGAVSVVDDTPESAILDAWNFIRA